MNDTGILYFNMGTKHLCRLLVSLASLRKVCDAPVAILHTADAGVPLLEAIAAAFPRVELRPVDVRRCRRHTAYVAKASLWRWTPFARSIYLDADTVVVRSPLPLVDAGGLVLTAFSRWVTTGSIVAGRLRQWLAVECPGVNVQQLVARTLTEPHRAINTGVFAFHRDAQSFLADWERLTQAGWRCSFTDELAAQLLLIDHLDYGITLVGDMWNWSPLYGAAEWSQAAVYHLHGQKHIARADGRGDRGHALWWPVWADLWRENVAGVRAWAPAGDKFLARYLTPADHSSSS